MWVEESDSLEEQDRGTRGHTRQAVFAGELVEADLGDSRCASGHSSCTVSSAGVAKADLLGDAFAPAPLASACERARGGRGGGRGGGPCEGVDCSGVGVMPLWVLRGTRVANSHRTGAPPNYVCGAGGRVCAAAAPCMQSAAPAALDMSS
jgi:hypothetical protein